MRTRRFVALLAALLTMSAVLALPASAKESAGSINQSITNDPTADLCVWGASSETWIAGRTYVATDTFTQSDHYGCSSPKNLPGSYLAAWTDLYKGGWPNVVLCESGASAFNPSPSSNFASASYDLNTCGQSTIYWAFGNLQMFVYPGAWYPQPPKLAVAGPVNGTCDPYCA